MKKKLLTITFVCAIVGVLAAIVLVGKNALQGTTSKSISNRSISELETAQPADVAVVSESAIQATEPAKEDIQAVDEPIEKPIATKNTDTPEKTISKNDTPIKKSNSDALTIKDRLISWGFQTATNRKVTAIILHSSYDALGSNPYDVDGILKEYKQYGVSAHYLIDRDGTAYRLVADENIAYHAGVSKLPNGETNVNAVSIGIELMNTQDDRYTDAQYKAVNALIVSLKKEYAITYVLGHDDIAPGRKTDPWNMDWSRINK